MENMDVIYNMMIGFFFLNETIETKKSKIENFKLKYLKMCIFFFLVISFSYNVIKK